MKFILWLVFSFLYAVLVVGLATSGIRLGMIPIMLLYGALNMAYRALCRSWDENKSDEKKREKKNAVPVSKQPEPKREEQSARTTAVPLEKQRIEKTNVVLYLYAGPQAGLTFRCAEGDSVVLGRGVQCDMVLDSYNAVSSSHCRITVGKNGVTVTDIGSTNGTIVDDKRIMPYMPVTVGHDSRIHLGNPVCAIQVQVNP